LGDVRRRNSDQARDFHLSAIRIVKLRTTHLACIRHVGPYEEVSDALWARLDVWAKRRRLSGPRVWFGIGHDSPATTQGSRLRFEAGIRVDGPFAADGEVTHQVIPAATFAALTHIGAYATLPAAYAALFPQVMSMPKWRVTGLPAVEIYHTTQVNAACALNHTEILIPVQDRMAPRAP
jgi:AraC family transcriptional regulator